MKKSALGRGLDSLIPTGFEIDNVASPGEQVRNIAIVEIVQNPDQPRKEFDEDALIELSKSIKQHGVIQPIVVTPTKGGYRIVAGERRYRASKLAKQKTISAVVRNHEKLEELEIALVENVQRVDLSPLEQALSIVKLHEEFSISYRDIAGKLGKAETTISNIVRLLQLPDEALEALRKNQITEGHARAILALKTDTNEQLSLLNKIITQKLSVRQAESLVQSNKASKSSRKPTKSMPSKAALDALSALDKSYAGRVTIDEKSSKNGTVSVSYSNLSELTDIISKLKNKVI